MFKNAKVALCQLHRISCHHFLIFRCTTRSHGQGNVEYVAVRAGQDECATPAKLVQNYVVCRLDKKMDVLLGFIKTHLKSKMIVFFTSCAQVCLFTAKPRAVCVSTTDL